jgi:amidase
MSERRPPKDPSSSSPPEPVDDDPATLTRRSLLRWGAIAGAAAPLAALPRVARAGSINDEAAIVLEEATIAEMQAKMTAGGLTSLALVNMYLERIAAIDEDGPGINSVLEL